MARTAAPPAPYPGLGPRDPAPPAGAADPTAWPVIRCHILTGAENTTWPAWIIGDPVAGAISRWSVGVAQPSTWWTIGAAGPHGTLGQFTIGDGDPSSAMDRWTEVTCDLEEWTLEQRAQRSALDQFDAADLTLRLDNRHRRFDPDSADSPYNVPLADGTISTGLRPGTPLTLTASWNGRAWPLFTGEVDQVDDVMSESLARQVELRCSDAFAVIGAYDGEASTPVGAGELASARVARVLDLIGWPASKRRLSETCTVPLLATDLAGNALSLCKQAAASEGGRLWVDGEGNVCLDSHSDTWSVPVSAAVQFSAGDDLLVSPALGTVRDREQVINRLTYSRDGGTPLTLVDSGSVAKYRIRSTTKSDLLCANDSDVASLARRDLRVQAWLDKQLPKLVPTLTDHRWWPHLLGWRPRYRCNIDYTSIRPEEVRGWGAGYWGEGHWGDDGGERVLHRCWADGRRISATPAKWDVELQLVDANGWSAWRIGDPTDGRIGAVPIAW